MKTVSLLISSIFGFVFGLIGFFILADIDPDNAYLWAISGGLFAFIMLYIFFLIHDKVEAKKYSKIEKNINSPILYKAPGLFNLINGKKRSGNIYLCQDGIILLSMDEKPYLLDEILKKDFDHFSFNEMELTVCTSDGRQYAIIVIEMDELIKKITEYGWL